jgi:hypothetical protein
VSTKADYAQGANASALTSPAREAAFINARRRLGVAYAVRVVHHEAINAKLDVLPLKNIEIKDYVCDTDLSNLSGNVA